MSHTWFERCLLVGCLLLGVWGLCAPMARADCPLYRLPTNRFGVDVANNYGRIADYDVGALHIGWYSNWAVDVAPVRPGGIEYAQLIWVDRGHWFIGGVEEPLTTLEAAVRANPGAMWMIGNEPECPNYPGGGMMSAQTYGDVYHELYGYIKGFDPTAQVAIGGIVEPTPVRLQWLNKLLDYYANVRDWGPMPVDVWTIHGIILPEMGPDCPVAICGEPAYRWGAGIPVGIYPADNHGELFNVVYGGYAETWNIENFKRFVRDFRAWMSLDRTTWRGLHYDYRNKPLMITEYGVLLGQAHGVPDGVVNDFMTASFDFMLNTTDATLGYPLDENRLVQRWLWMSLNDQPAPAPMGGVNGGLFDYRDNTFPGTLTAFGLNYMNYTNSLLTGSACINGTVHLESRPAVPNASHVTMATLTLLAVGCPQPDLRSVTTNPSGVFTLCNVPPGTYDILVKGYNTLATRTNGVELLAGSKSVDLGLLRSGDANNDNQVTILDFSMLTATYRAVKGGPTYDDRADFNNDGIVDIRDFSLLATHFGQVGAK